MTVQTPDPEQSPDQASNREIGSAGAESVTSVPETNSAVQVAPQLMPPGEEKTVAFELNERALAYYDPDQQAWVAEPGEFEVLVGSSSRDIRAQATFELK